MKIIRGIYSLAQPGVLANKLLEKLEKCDHYRVDYIRGLFTHTTRPIWFTPVVGDFGVKCIGN